MISRGSVVGVVLAAGASRRAGGAKALALLDGRTFAERTVGTLLDAGCDDVLVIVAEPHGERVAAALGDVATLVQNTDPARGMSTSLCLGLATARELGAGAVMVALVDHPAVSSLTARRLIEAWRQGDALVVRPSFEGQRGHPYLIDEALFDALLALAPGADPRPVLRRAAPQLEVVVDDGAVLDDWDTAAAIRAAGGELE